MMHGGVGSWLSPSRFPIGSLRRRAVTRSVMATRGREFAVGRRRLLGTDQSLIRPITGSGRRLLYLRPLVPPECASESGDSGRETPARDRYQGDLADNFRVGNHPSENAGDRRRELRYKADSKPGGDHRLDPILAFTAEADLERKPVLATALVQVVLVFAIDSRKVSLSGDIGDADPVLLPEAMTHRECDAEPLAVQRADFEPGGEGVRLGQPRE